MTNILLIGFMGAGKSTVGRRLAKTIGFRFLDFDRLIVEREGRTIPEIFAVQGERYFRDLETAILTEQLQSDRTVYATGGGIVGRPENRELLKKVGRTVYLNASWATLEKRLSRSKGRPLADPRKGWDETRRLWESRQPWYEEAELVIDTDHLPIAEVVRRIIAKANLGELVR